MAQIRKISQEIEIKSSGDMHFELYKYKLHELPKMSPGVVKSCELVEGEPGIAGSVAKWTYNQDGRLMTSKEIISVIDDEKRLITFKVVEADLMKSFNSFEFHLQINKNGTNDSVSWTLEYEKISDAVADPNALLDVLMAMTKDIETYHLNN